MCEVVRRAMTKIEVVGADFDPRRGRLLFSLPEHSIDRSPCHYFCRQKDQISCISNDRLREILLAVIHEHDVGKKREGTDDLRDKTVAFPNSLLP